jgi:3-methyladenine DNA glycosylase AlkD
VDAACCYLFAHAKPVWKKTSEWSHRKEEFVKRAAFSLMAYLAYKDKAAPNARFLRLLAIIHRESRDERNFVKKAVNWALRNIGKRNRALNRAAIRTAKEIRALDSRTARWIAADALRELTGPAVQKRLRNKLNH